MTLPPKSKAALTKAVLAIGLLVASGCANLNDPYNTGGSGGGYGGGPYGNPPPYYGGGGYYGGPGYNNYPNYNQQQQQQQQQRELERERRRLEEERRRLEQERQSQQNNYYQQPPQPRPVERCPAGFSPSERKCSPDERRRGCRDIRLPGGLGCVAR